jgi:hypothetical protein
MQFIGARQRCFGLKPLARSLGKIIRVRERYELNVFVEAFNLLNVANLTGYGVNLLEGSAFGRPTGRTTQVFGSGGPRAFQLAARFSFWLSLRWAIQQSSG